MEIMAACLASTRQKYQCLFRCLEKSVFAHPSGNTERSNVASAGIFPSTHALTPIFDRCYVLSSVCTGTFLFLASNLHCLDSIS
jgi:hypothetical protein